MLLITPKLDWLTNPTNPTSVDLNRIEQNIDFLNTDIETKKGVIVDALNTMGRTASVSDTHDILATKIKDISDDANAVLLDVLASKTFYQGGLKRTGTMLNYGNKIFTPTRATQTLSAGYINSLTVNPVQVVAGDVIVESEMTSVYTQNTIATKKREITINYAGTVRVSFNLRASIEASDTAYAQIYVNDVARGTLRSRVGNWYTTYTQDFTVGENDIVSLYLWCSGNNNKISMNQFFDILTTMENFTSTITNYV